MAGKRVVHPYGVGLDANETDDEGNLVLLILILNWVIRWSRFSDPLSFQLEDITKY
jgi:hypothetical protein